MVAHFGSHNRNGGWLPWAWYFLLRRTAEPGVAFCGRPPKKNGEGALERRVTPLAHSIPSGYLVARRRYFWSTPSLNYCPDVLPLATENLAADQVCDEPRAVNQVLVGAIDLARCASGLEDERV